MEYRRVIHKPVLLAEVTQQLSLKPGATFVDCTLGGAGHAEAILKAIGKAGTLVGIDLDTEAIKEARENLADFSQQIKLVKANFKDLEKVLEKLKAGEPEGILFDLGFSSTQVGRAQRGFSYQQAGPLDMRFDQRQKLSAAEVVNSYSKKDLKKIFKRYGEERWAGRVATFIEEARRRKPLVNTLELSELIKKAIPAKFRRRGPHPAKRIFQALRIETNKELENLEEGLKVAIKKLKRGARVAVISYHSLEDRIVKETFKDFEGKAKLKIITKKPIYAKPEEVKINPRSRSAKLRVAEKIAT